MIEFREVTKRYGRVKALDGVSLTLRSGRTTACVGPNGSGKTTMIKSILGLVKTTSGAIIFDNEQLDGPADYRRRIGYMPQAPRFPDNLRPGELVDMLHKIRGGNGSRLSDLLERFGLQDQWEKKLGALSGGTRQKINLVLASLFTPDVLVMDEPTAGLDPLSATVFKDFVRSEQKRGATILITSHIMSELEELAHDVVFIMDGRVPFTGSVADILTQTQKPGLEEAVAHLIRRAS